MADYDFDFEPLDTPADTAPAHKHSSSFDDFFGALKPTATSTAANTPALPARKTSAGNRGNKATTMVQATSRARSGSSSAGKRRKSPKSNVVVRGLGSRGSLRELETGAIKNKQQPASRRNSKGSRSSLRGKSAGKNSRGSSGVSAKKVSTAPVQAGRAHITPNLKASKRKTMSVFLTDIEEITRLNNMIEVERSKNKALADEIRTLKMLQRRQEKAIEKMDTQNEDFPRIIEKLQSEAKALRHQAQLYKEKLAASEKRAMTEHEEFVRLRERANKMERILRERNLDDHDKLVNEITKLKKAMQEKDEALAALAKEKTLLVKDRERRLEEALIAKNTIMRELHELRTENDNVSSKLKESEKKAAISNIYSRHMNGSNMSIASNFSRDSGKLNGTKKTNASTYLGSVVEEGSLFAGTSKSPEPPKAQKEIKHKATKPNSKTLGAKSASNPSPSPTPPQEQKHPKQQTHLHHQQQEPAPQPQLLARAESPIAPRQEEVEQKIEQLYKQFDKPPEEVTPAAHAASPLKPSFAVKSTPVPLQDTKRDQGSAQTEPLDLPLPPQPASTFKPSFGFKSTTSSNNPFKPSFLTQASLISPTEPTTTILNPVESTKPREQSPQPAPVDHDMQVPVDELSVAPQPPKPVPVHKSQAVVSPHKPAQPALYKTIEKLTAALPVTASDTALSETKLNAARQKLRDLDASYPAGSHIESVIVKKRKEDLRAQIKSLESELGGASSVSTYANRSRDDTAPSAKSGGVKSHKLDFIGSNATGATSMGNNSVSKPENKPDFLSSSATSTSKSYKLNFLATTDTEPSQAAVPNAVPSSKVDFFDTVGDATQDEGKSVISPATASPVSAPVDTPKFDFSFLNSSNRTGASEPVSTGYVPTFLQGGRNRRGMQAITVAYSDTSSQNHDNSANVPTSTPIASKEPAASVNGGSSWLKATREDDYEAAFEEEEVL